MIASTLSLFVMCGVLSALLFFGRTGLAAGHYQKMEAEVRRGLELFSEDARLATDISWGGAWSITLSVPDAGNVVHPVSYLYEPSRPGSSTGELYRVSASGERELLVHDVSSDFAFHRYKLEQPGVSDNTAANDLETKQIQINLRTLHVTAGGPASTQAAVSARYILRNKNVGR
jgi:hypothetical protein